MLVKDMVVWHKTKNGRKGTLWTLFVGRNASERCKNEEKSAKIKKKAENIWRFAKLVVPLHRF